jgi:hypothetical protein
LDIHAKAQRAAAEAEQALQARKVLVARRLYGVAAVLQREALDAVPPDKLRTRAIMGVSLGALLVKAEQFDDAEQAICSLLGERDLPAFASVELRELLEVTWEERAMKAANVRYTGDEIQVSLRGGVIGRGTAPADEAVHFIQTSNALVTRITEWKAGRTFRQKGQAAPDIKELVESRATQPIASSYRFSIKLVAPRQGNLFKQAAPKPGQIADAVMDIVRHVADGRLEELTRFIPDKKYRVAILKLARNVVPSGGSGSVGAVDMSRPGAPALEKVQLVSGARAALGRTIRSETEDERRGEVVEVKGTLRALDLDKKTLAIDRSGQARQQLSIRRDAALDDVLGPLVNRRVVARGVRRGQVIETSDIEPAGD